jgi:hypothetical protein
MLFQLLESLAVGGYPDYFISIGINSDSHIELQVLAIPLQNGAPHGIDKASSGSHHDTKEDPTFVLASIPIHPGSVGKTLDKWDDTTWICHEYTGRTINTIRVWIRDDLFGGCFSVFSIPIDFGKSSDQWFTPVNSFTIEEGVKEEEMRYIVDHKRAAEKHDVSDCLQPGTLGKKFIWWKTVTPLANSTSPTLSSKIPIRLHLFSSEITSLPSSPPKLFEGGTVPDSYMLWLQTCVSYPTCELECPFDCEIENTILGGHDPSRAFLFSVIADERSGTVVITLVSGDLLILRFGHP